MSHPMELWEGYKKETWEYNLYHKNLIWIYAKLIHNRVSLLASISDDSI